MDAEVLDKTICTILDNQKKLYKDVEKIKTGCVYEHIKNLESYSDFVTCDYTEGIYKKEKNEIMKSNDFIIYTTVKQYNNKIHKHTEIVYNDTDKKTISDKYEKCTKNEFEKLWKLN